MGCVLRALGDAFDALAYLQLSPFEAAAVFRKGEPCLAGSGRAWPASGFNVTVSEAGFDDLDGQIEQAIEFLDQHEDELRRLGQFPGVEQVEIEFGIRWREVASQADSFPPELLWRAGALDIVLVVTHYVLRQRES